MSESDRLELSHFPLPADRLAPGWVIKPVGDTLADISSGFASGKHNDTGVGVPHLRPMNVSRTGEIDLTVLKSVSPNKDSRRLARGDVLFNNTNSPAWVGKTALIDSDADLAFSNHMTRLRPSKAIHPAFLSKQLHFLQSSGYFQNQCTKHVNQASISPGFLSSRVPVLVAPLFEQRRIVAKLDALQGHSRKARAALDAIPALLDRFRQSVLAAAFRGDLTKDWRAANPDVEPASELLKRIRAERKVRWVDDYTEAHTRRAQGRVEKKGLVWTKADEAKARKQYRKKAAATYEEAPLPDTSFGVDQLPDGWEWCSVGEITECLDRIRRPVTKKDRNTGPFPYYGANGQVDSVDKWLFDEELVLVTEDETFYGRTKPIAYLVKGKCWVNNHAHVLRAIPPINNGFVCQSLMHYRVIPWLSGTTGRAKLTQGALNSLPIALPPLAELAEITSRVEAALDWAQSILQTTSGLSPSVATLDQSILAKAFRGELVPQDPNDEPAAELLARIRAEREAAEPAKRTRSRTST